MSKSENFKVMKFTKTEIKKFEVLTAVFLNIEIFSNITLCSLCRIAPVVQRTQFNNSGKMIIQREII